jgi:IMP dehydrogenase
VSNEIEIGRGKRGRRAYSFDDIAVVPSRRTRDPKDVSVGWQIDAYHFDLPIVAAPMDSVMTPDSAVALGRFGGLGVLDLEGLWTRYESPEPLLAEIAALPGDEATRRMQAIYSEPIKPELRSPRSARRSSTRRWSTPASTCSSSGAPRSPRSTCRATPSR